jgi:aminoglycoside phosphotransferase (APT) family kinase protein
MRHGYTNDTRGDGRSVVKRYRGPDAAARRARECLALTTLAGRLPVPALVAHDLIDADAAGADGLWTEFVPGVQGQELIEARGAAPVLWACGEVLRAIHRLDARVALPGVPAPAGAVLVHGDYGPNNVLLDPDTLAVTAVVDWEWAHPGRPIEDLAWCEWIVRMHHAEHADRPDVLDALFDAYGDRPAWAERHGAMVDRCRELLRLGERWDAEAARLWQERLAVTAAWTP